MLVSLRALGGPGPRPQAQVSTERRSPIPATSPPRPRKTIHPVPRRGTKRLAPVRWQISSPLQFPAPPSRRIVVGVDECLAGPIAPAGRACEWAFPSPSLSRISYVGRRRAPTVSVRVPRLLMGSGGVRDGNDDGLAGMRRGRRGFRTLLCTHGFAPEWSTAHDPPPPFRTSVEIIRDFHLLVEGAAEYLLKLPCLWRATRPLRRTRDAGTRSVRSGGPRHRGGCAHG